MEIITNINKITNIERTERGREKLLTLEKEGKYVFHGSAHTTDILKPRQAYNYNKETGQTVKDGNPAVFATPYAEVAIFRAMINEKNTDIESTSGVGINNGKLRFSSTKELLDQAKKKTGKVYVLDKEKFDRLEGMECRSENNIAPLEVIEVREEDLPKNIEIIK